MMDSRLRGNDSFSIEERDFESEPHFWLNEYMDRIPIRVRVGVACIVSFYIASTIGTRYAVNPTEFDTVRLTADIQGAISILTSIQIPTVHLETLTTQNTYPTETPTSLPEPTIDYQFTNPDPTIPIQRQPTAIPSVPVYPTRIPTIMLTSIPISKPIQPTTEPQPTKTPKPTKGPDLFPIDTALKRPGETVDDIIAQAAAKACVPKEVLRTLASIESGGFFDTVIPKYLQLYNSEGWWASSFIAADEEGRKRVCSGYSYDSNTGLIFGDSKHAGERCRDGSNSGLTTAGVMQLSTYLNDHYKSQAAKLVGSKNVDRRIIFDALVIAGLNIKENTKAATCTNWDARTVVKAACSYYGSCGIKDGTYYCATFCRNYQKYGGKDCSGAIAQFADTCWK